MGVPKALLEYAPGTSFLDQLTRLFAGAGCEVLAVLGKDAARVRALHPHVGWVENEGWQHGQLSSVRVALSHALAHGAERVLVCPVDMPALQASTVEAVRGALDGAEAAVATWRGQPGHPLGLSRAGAQKVLEMADIPHLEAALARLAVRRVPVEDPGVCLNFNLPEDYERHFGHSPRPLTALPPRAGADPAPG